MQSLPITTDLLDDVERQLKRIPLFKHIFEDSPAQFLRLIHLAEVIEVDAGEYILRQGEKDDGVYFLLKGQLEVGLSEDDRAAINTIYPGEMFGVIAMITQQPRAVYVKASQSQRKHLAFKLNTDFISDQSRHAQLSLPMQICFYRFALDNIRWLLEQHKMSHPKHEKVTALRQMRLPPIAATQDDTELQALKEQCQMLAHFIVQWNTTLNDDSHKQAKNDNSSDESNKPEDIDISEKNASPLMDEILNDVVNS